MADPFDLFYLPFRPALDANGIVVAGASLTFYTSNTSTLAPIFADAALTTPLANPLTANAAGVWPSIYIDNAKTYRVVLRDEGGAVLNEVDPYVPGSVGGSVGDTGPANSTYPTIIAVQAADTTNLSAILSEALRGGLFAWNPSNLSAFVTADPMRAVYIPPLTDTTGASGAYVRQNAFPYSITWFGAKIDGVKSGAGLDDWTGTNDGPAWNAAIKLARATGVGVINYPNGTTGKSIVTTAIWDPAIDGEFPSGLSFIGQCRSGYNRYFSDSEPAVIWRGPGVCWGIDTTGLPSARGFAKEVGNWSWRDMNFLATKASGTIFDFNRCLVYAQAGTHPSDVDVLMHILFDNVKGFGAGGGEAQTGDFIRGFLTFNMVLRPTCQIRDWAHGPWVYGGDNNILDGRSQYNRFDNFRVQRSPGGGNSNIINAAYVGPPRPAVGSDESYAIYDSGTVTTINPCGIELLPDEDPKALACLYLNGTSTIINGVQTTQGRTFRMGPMARDITWVAPFAGTITAGNEPIIDEPDTYDAGIEYNQRTITFINPEARFTGLVGNHARFRWVGKNLPAGVRSLTPELSAPGLIADTLGARPAGVFINALNYAGQSGGLGTGIPPRYTATDNTAGVPYALQIRGTDPAASGFFYRFVIGREFLAGDTVQIVIRSRVTAAMTTGGYNVLLQKNGVEVSSSKLEVHKAADYSTIYRTQYSTPVALTGFSNGDVLSLQVFGSGNVDQFVDFVMLRPVAPRIADLSGTATTADIATAVNAALAAGRRGLPIGA